MHLTAHNLISLETGIKPPLDGSLNSTLSGTTVRSQNMLSGIIKRPINDTTDSR